MARAARYEGAAEGSSAHRCGAEPVGEDGSADAQSRLRCGLRQSSRTVANGQSHRVPTWHILAPAVCLGTDRRDKPELAHRDPAVQPRPAGSMTCHFSARIGDAASIYSVSAAIYW